MKKLLITIFIFFSILSCTKLGLKDENKFIYLSSVNNQEGIKFSIDQKDEFIDIIKSSDDYLNISFDSNYLVNEIEDIINYLPNNLNYLKIDIYDYQFGEYIKLIIRDKNISTILFEVMNCSTKIEIDKNFSSLILNSKSNIEFICTSTIEDNGFHILDENDRLEIEKDGIKKNILNLT